MDLFSFCLYKMICISRMIGRCEKGGGELGCRIFLQCVRSRRFDSKYYTLSAELHNSVTKPRLTTLFENSSCDCRGLLVDGIKGGFLALG